MKKTNIVLVGFMGTGKSAAGRAVSRRLEHPFIDMDAMIEERTKRRISEIFAKDGEGAFRALERDLVKELSQRRDLVIAAGGGIVLNPDNVRDFSETGVVICLKASPAAILSRVEAQTHRPLLQTAGDKSQRILDLLKERQPLYDAIPNQVDTTRLSPSDVADRVIEFYEQENGSGEF